MKSDEYVTVSFVIADIGQIEMKSDVFLSLFISQTTTKEVGINETGAGVEVNKDENHMLRGNELDDKKTEFVGVRVSDVVCSGIIFTV